MSKGKAIRLATVTLYFVARGFAETTPAQELNTVTAKVEIRTLAAAASAEAQKTPRNSSEVVVWLTPLDRPASPVDLPAKRPQLVQRNKSFEPHLLIVPVGSTVDFPNRDPFFHNVFSLFDGKRFDLGLYEAGASNSVRFDRSGVSLLFCNIHPEMSAVVVALNTPYYSVSDSAGNISIKNVPEGRYEVHAWYERSLPGDLKSVTRTVNISSASHNLGPLIIPENAGFSLTHTNKYGQDYTPPPAQGYTHP